MSVATSVLRIQRGEGRIASMMATLTLVSMATFTIGESGIDALFFDRVGAHALPVMYILQGATTFVVMIALTGLLGRIGHRRAYLLTPVFLGLLLLVEWGIVQTNVGWIYRALWITSAVANLLLSVALWGTAGAVTDTRQAKRLFPIFAAGGILGSVIGGLTTRPLASLVGAENLLLLWVGGLAAGFLLTRLILGGGGARAVRRQRRARSALRDLRSSMQFVRHSSLLTWMTASAVLFSLLFYFLYLPYARAASEHFPDPNALAGFFGLFWAAVTAAAFLVSMLVTNRFFAWFGVAAIAVVLPCLYAGAFATLFVASGFLTLVVLRFALGTWLQGVAGPAWETLTNVVPESRRDQTRAFLTGGPAQLGTIVAGLVALVGQNALTLKQFAGIGLVIAVGTIVATLGIRRSYIGALIDALRAGRPQVFEQPSLQGAPRGLPTDADAIGALTNSLRASDVRERRLAYQLLADVPPDSRPSEIADGLDDDDPVVRLAAIRILDRSSPSARGALLSLFDDPDPSVAAAAAAGALDSGEDAASRARLRRLLADPDDRVRRAALDQMDLAPSAAVPTLIDECLKDPSAQVRAAALEQLARAAPRDALDPALAGLRDPDPTVRSAAGRALGAAGGEHVEYVLDALDDPRTADAAVEAVRRLEPNGDADRTRGFIQSATEEAESDRRLAEAIPSDDEATRLLRDAVLERGRRRARAALWAATLLGSRRAEMATAIENLDAGPGQVATALETLESAGDPALLRPLIALWESGAAPTRQGDWLQRTLEDEDGFIVRCAELVRANREGGDVVHGSIATLSGIERVLFLRKVPLFAALSPEDLDRVAQLAEERGYADSEVIVPEGEVGEELHIVVDGAIRVVQGLGASDRVIARRTAGDVVGEMSIITQEPRMASLVAEGAVRTVSLSRIDFESMLRERPGIALAVMRVLAHRLAEDAGGHGTSGP